MTTKLLLNLFLILGLVGNAQNDEKPVNVELVDVVIWEAEARSGGKFIGVAPDQFEAQNAIDELTFIKEGTKYHILGSDINTKPVLINKNVSIKDDFISEDDYLEFKYISEIELIALEYIQGNDMQTAISFYKSVSREKNSFIIEKRLTKLYHNYSKYLFEYETGASLVSYTK